MEKVTVLALEKILQVWEDYWALMAIRNRFSKAHDAQMWEEKGAIRNYKRLRQVLLSVHQAWTPEEDQLFLSPAPVGDGPTLDKDAIWALPNMLTAWSRFSRRVYALSEDLQLQLLATNLEGVDLADLTLPFSSFGIELALPISAAEREEIFILVSSEPGEGGTGVSKLQIITVPKVALGYRKLPAQELSRIEKKLHQLGRLNRSMSDVSLGNKRCVGLHLLVETDSRGNTLQDFIGRVSPAVSALKSFPIAEQALRLVMGLALYMQSRPAKEQAIYTAPAPTGPLPAGGVDPSAITSGALVFQVNSAHPLTKEQRDALKGEGGGGSGQQSWHFREGHWRRPPGQGHDPEAPKVVHVRPYLVRVDRAPEELGLPAGSKKVL